MSINVASVLKGPALIKYGGSSFYTKADISVQVEHVTMPIEVDRWGKVDERVLDTNITVGFTPAGEWEALAILFRYVTMAIGDFITGSSDTPLEIHTFAGRKLTLHNAAITKMPSIEGGAKKTLLGAVEFTSFVKNNVARTTDNSRWSLADAALTDTTFDPADILVQSYDIAWGEDAPWDDISTKEGFTLDWNLQLTPQETDKDGIFTQQFSGLDVTVKMQPLGVSDTNVWTEMLVQGAGAARGRSLNAGGKDLIISAPGVYIAVYGAAMKSGPQAFGRTALRIGEVGFIATRTFTAGAPNPLCFIGTEAP